MGGTLQGIKPTTQWVRYTSRQFCSLFWPAFLEILQSLKICLILEYLVNMAAMIESSHALKVKNFSSNKELQVCHNILHISQDPIIENGQRREVF
jgi:hypothetical protein